MTPLQSAKAPVLWRGTQLTVVQGMLYKGARQGRRGGEATARRS